MNRFKELRLKAGFKSQSDLAKVLFVNQTAVSQWERGITTPSPQLLCKLAELYDVPVDYLLGRQIYPDTPQSTGGVWVPVVGKVAAGIPIETVEYIEDYEEISLDMASKGDHFALRIKGDSMEPRIQDGDVVIVRKQTDCESGDVAVIAVNGSEATVKRIKKRPDGLLLIPSNHAYEPVFFSNNEVQELPVSIIGKVVELRGKF